MRARASTFCLAVLLLAYLPGPASAQEPFALMEDAAGDVQLSVQGTGGGDPAGIGALDLVGATVVETADELRFALAVADMSSGGKQDMVWFNHRLYFTANDLDYRVIMGRFRTDEPWAYLSQYDGSDDAWRFTEELHAVIEGDTISVAVPRDEVQDSAGATPMPGWVLDGFWAESYGLFNIGGDLNLGPASVPVPESEYHDRMPDSGSAPLGYPIEIGLRQSGEARLWSPTPMRASNGEATTIVYEVVGENVGTAAQTYQLDITGVPTNWDVVLPQPVVEIEAGGTTTFPVVVTTPFAHQHGAARTFLVEMRGLAVPADVGRAELGVRYTEVPQPAGHHDTLHFHTLKEEADEFETVLETVFGFDQTRAPYMNTLEEDPLDSGEPVAGWSICSLCLDGEEVYSRFRWNIPLSPALQMGLDFDTVRTGMLQVTLETQLPLPAARLDGVLVHIGGISDDDEVDRFFPQGERTVLAHVSMTDPVDMMGGTQLFETTVVPTPAADLIPFQDDAGLRLELNLTSLRPELFGSRDPPRLVGGSMGLPLHEYHDPVEDVFSTVEGLVIHAQTPQKRFVNPGESAVYRLQLMDHGRGAGRFDATLSGIHAEWATILGDTSFRVEKGGARDLAVAITAPEDAVDGDLADVVLYLTESDDPTTRTLARMVAEVDTESDHDDEGGELVGLQGELTAEKESPGLLVFPVLSIVALLALRRRRAT